MTVRITTTRVYRPTRGAGLLAWLRAALDRANQRHRLAELDARMLRDIGVSRPDAEHEAAKPFWRKGGWE